MTRSEFGRFIQNERIKQGVSQLELAEISGFTRESISYWENGHKSITLENADKLLSALGKKMMIEGDNT